MRPQLVLVDETYEAPQEIIMAPEPPPDVGERTGNPSNAIVLRWIEQMFLKVVSWVLLAAWLVALVVIFSGGVDPAHSLEQQVNSALGAAVLGLLIWLAVWIVLTPLRILAHIHDKAERGDFDG